MPVKTQSVIGRKALALERREGDTMGSERNDDADRLIYRAGAALLDPYAPLARDIAIETTHGLISRVFPAAHLSTSATVVDLGDVVLAAGIVDSHVHLGFDGSEHPDAIMQGPETDSLSALIERIGASALSSGVTTVRDLGCVGTTVTSVTSGWAFDRRFPRVVAANEPLTVLGGHCSYMATACDDVDELVAAIVAHDLAGSTVIKIMLTGGFMHAEGDTPYRSVYDQATLDRAVTEAHRRGLLVAAHAHGSDGIAIAARAGVDSIEHCSMAAHGGVRIDDATLQMMAERRILAVPTVSALWDGPLPWATRDEAIGVISRLHESGVPIALGTDLGIPGSLPGAHVDGLRILREAGLSGAEAWASATVNGAIACGLGGLVGRIRPGFAADFLTTAADPREDLDTLAAVRHVVTAGRLARSHSERDNNE